MSASKAAAQGCGKNWAVTVTLKIMRANKGECEDGRPTCAQRSCGSVSLINDSSNDGKCCCTFALLMTKT